MGHMKKKTVCGPNSELSTAVRAVIDVIKKLKLVQETLQVYRRIIYSNI